VRRAASGAAGMGAEHTDTLLPCSTAPPATTSSGRCRGLVKGAGAALDANLGPDATAQLARRMDALIWEGRSAQT
jgi:hypothetical protein